MIERSFAAPRTYTNEHIEEWAAVYLANPHLYRSGVLFERFLYAPAAILAAYARPAMTVSHCGLLQEQLDVRERVDDEAALRDRYERAVAALAANGLFRVTDFGIVKPRHLALPRRRRAERNAKEA